MGTLGSCTNSTARHHTFILKLVSDTALTMRLVTGLALVCVLFVLCDARPSMKRQGHAKNALAKLAHALRQGRPGGGGGPGGSEEDVDSGSVEEGPPPPPMSGPPPDYYGPPPETWAEDWGAWGEQNGMLPFWYYESADAPPMSGPPPPPNYINGAPPLEPPADYVFPDEREDEEVKAEVHELKKFMAKLRAAKHAKKAAAMVKTAKKAAAKKAAAMKFFQLGK